MNLKDDAHTPDDFLLQALETAQPYQIETLVYLAEKEDAPIADSVTEGVFLWLKQSSWLQHYRQAHGLSGDSEHSWAASKYCKRHDGDEGAGSCLLYTSPSPRD